MKNFWGVKHKGFSTIVLLGLLSFVSSLALLIQIQLKQLILIQNTNVVDEKIEIQVIKKIKQCYYEQNCEDQVLEIEGTQVDFRFFDLTAEVTLEDGTLYKFTYDEPFLCIGSFDIIRP